MNVKLNYNFLVIGGGLAGLYTSYKASKLGKVALVLKSDLQVSNSYLAQGGIAAVFSDEDSHQFHLEDTLKAGRGLCDKNAVEVLVKEGTERAKELIELGMQFDKENGEIILGLEGGHSHRRILHSGGDATGREVVKFFIELVKNEKNIDIFENTFVHNLIYNDNACFGAHAFSFNSHKNITFLASKTILATGGSSGVYIRTTNPKITTGDGIALAYNAGCKIRDIEFIQFHPTAFISGSGDSFLISEAVRGEGAYLLNHNGERFMLDKHPLAELAPRDIVAKSIFNEMKKNGKDNVFLSLKHKKNEKLKTRFSNIAKAVANFGLDLFTDNIPIAPAAHYVAGGIVTDINGFTGVKNLYACGECSCTGIHGANRLASNSLLECLVFGNRIVNKLEKEGFDEQKTLSFNSKEIRIYEEKKELYLSLKNKVKELMNTYVGIVRVKEELEKVLTLLDEIKGSYNFSDDDYYSVKLNNIITVAKLTTLSALKREESRGGHYRADFPETDEKLYHITHFNGKIEIENKG